MPINATVTAKAGPNIQATAIVLTNIASMLVMPDKKVVQFFNNNDGGAPEREFDLNGVTTFTVSISGSTYTVTIS